MVASPVPNRDDAPVPATANTRGRTPTRAGTHSTVTPTENGHWLAPGELRARYPSHGVSSAGTRRPHTHTHGAP